MKLLYTALSFGWTGANNQWKHFYGAYLYFAAIATPLVLSVHSVVSWDFAMAQVPGWHSTIFAPYFVAGAIFSGVALVINLLIPIRKAFKLEHIVTLDHMEKLAKLVLLTSTIVGYSYLVEFFMRVVRAQQVRARHVLVPRHRPLLVGVLDHVHLQRDHPAARCGSSRSAATWPCCSCSCCS